MGPQNHGEQSSIEKVMIVKLVGNLRSFNQPFFAISPLPSMSGISCSVVLVYLQDQKGPSLLAQISQREGDCLPTFTQD